MDDKQAQKKSLKDRIKMLMNKNKQIDNVMDVSPSQQKQHLQQQKDDNNDTNISNDNKPSNNVKETDNTTNKISNIINPHTGDYIIAVIIVLIIAISINVIIISKRRKGGNK